LRSEDPDPQGRFIPLVRVPNLNVLWVPVLVLRYAVAHASLEFGYQAIEPGGRAFQDVVLRVALAKEFLGGEKLLPVLEDLRAELSFVVHSGNFGFPFLGIGLFLGHEGIKGLAICVPDFHHAGALGVEFLFVTHGATLAQVVPAVYHTSRPTREIRSKRGLRTILSDVLF
jgi:hypothetical protein